MVKVNISQSAATSGDPRMSRARLYVLIDSFEADLRRSIEKHLLSHAAEADIFPPADLEKIQKKWEADGAPQDISFAHYLDLQQAVDVLLRGKNDLPYELAVELTSQAPHFPLLSPIRHRVMHGRPLKETDAQVVLAQLEPLKSKYWADVKGALKRARVDPAWEPMLPDVSNANDRVLHNLPDVDYDETTLVGRKDERSKLIEVLVRRRNPVNTLIGEGGIGKTALALEIAYQLLDMDDQPYEAILWVSLKTEKLTAYGVEELSNAIRGINETIDALGSGLVSDFSGSLEELSEALEGIETLIIIDNLESADGQEIVTMYDQLPSSVSYLFTSRWGIGQLERTHQIPPLAEKDAVLLLRRFAAARGQKGIAGLSNQAAQNIVGELRRSPLAIKWFILASAAGNVPLQRLREQDELLDFCVRNVVDQLSVDSQAVLNILLSLDRSIGFEEFSVLSEMSIDSLRKSTQQLTNSSLVQVQAESAGAIAGRLSLTSTARAFLDKIEISDEFLATIRKRERQLKASSSLGSASRRGGALGLDKAWPRDERDRTATYLLQSAIALAKSTNYSAAWAKVERAKSFHPEFSEIYRVSGRVHALEGRAERALTDFELAVKYAMDDQSAAARALFESADVLSKDLREALMGLSHAVRARELVECFDTAYLVGKLKVWSGDFEGAQETLEDALDLAAKRQEMLTITTMVDGYGRWAGQDFREQQYENGLARACTGFHLGSRLLRGGALERRLVDALTECVNIAIRSQTHADVSALISNDRAMLEMGHFVQKHLSDIGTKKLRYLKDSFRTSRINARFSPRTAEVLSSVGMKLANY